MKKKGEKIMNYKSVHGALFVSLLILPMMIMPLHVYATATIWTDKPDYTTYETVTIYGSGFLANVQVTITIMAPDSSVDTIYAWTDGSGAFTAQYTLNGIVGTYTVTATDGTNTATTTFTEGAITPELWGYTLEPSPKWTHGDVKGYYECQWVPYKIEIENAKEDSVTYTLTVIVHLDYYDGTNYGLDDVRNFQMWRDGVSETPSISGPTVDGWESGIQQKQFSWTFTTTSTRTPKKDENCTLSFEVHIAIGAHNYPGSKVHTHIHSITSVPSGGHRDVPVVVKGPPPEADVAIQKTGVNYAHEGDPITYQFTVTNNGPGTAYNVQVIDNLLGDLTGNLPDTTLDPDEVNTFSVNYVVPTPSGDIANTVTVTSTTSDPNSANNQASWTVDVLHAGIDVSKSGPNYAHQGDTITYTITVSNPSTDTTMYKVSVIDSLLGDKSSSFSNSLAPLTSETKTFTYTVTSLSGDPILNTVTVKYKDALDTEKTDSASWTVDVLHPGIDVSKTADKTMAHEGDTITYTITVSNTGDCPLYSVFVTDTVLGPIYSNGLALGETKTFTKSYPVPTPSGDISNTVTASGYDALGRQVSDSASWFVDVLHPGIQVVKSGPAEIHVGETITYTYLVTNTGDCPLKDISVSDDLAGSGSYVSGDTDLDGWLDLTETWMFTATYVAPDVDPIVNKATASGTDNLGKTVTDEDTWSVDVLHPGIHVSKSGPLYAHEGDTITYTITVSNPSTDTTMYKVSVIDSLLGDVSVYFSASLAPLASESRSFTYHVPISSGDISNTVTATYKNGLNQPETDSASWFVDVLHPGIDVTKTANATQIHYCDWVEYTITVENTGDCPLYVVKDDPTLGLHWEGWLASGERHVEVVDYHPEDDPTINTVTVTGTDELGRTVSDSASWTVDILHPGIDVTKTGPLYAHEGDTITYTITVSNTGDCPLYSVFVTDTVLGPIYSNGLALGETKTFIVNYPVPIPSGDISNTVTASGSDVLGLSVSDSASWFVKVQYQITVTASPAGAIGGTFKVTYTKCGTIYTNVPHTTTWTEWVDSGTTVTVSDPQDLVNGAPGIRYKFDHYDPSATVTMTGSKTITLCYKTQYYLTVLIYPDGLAPLPTPPSGWYDECTYVTLTASLTAHDTTVYTFSCWRINGQWQKYKENQITIHMDSPRIAVACYCGIGDPIGDVNLDGEVDMIDIATIARHYGAKIGEPNYSIPCDINLDGKIDLRDLATAARNFTT